MNAAPPLYWPAEFINRACARCMSRVSLNAHAQIKWSSWRDLWCFSSLETAMKTLLRTTIYSMVTHLVLFCPILCVFWQSAAGRCLKLLNSRLLSFGIILGSVLGIYLPHSSSTNLLFSRRRFPSYLAVKVPQILKCVGAQSAENLSYLAMFLELAAATITSAYNFNKGFPFRWPSVLHTLWNLGFSDKLLRNDNTLQSTETMHTYVKWGVQASPFPLPYALLALACKVFSCSLFLQFMGREFLHHRASDSSADTDVLLQPAVSLLNALLPHFSRHRLVFDIWSCYNRNPGLSTDFSDTYDVTQQGTWGSVCINYTYYSHHVSI